MTETILEPIYSTRVLAVANGCALILQRSAIRGQEQAGLWEMAGGKLDYPGESPLQAGLREFSEESQLDLEILTQEPILLEKDRRIPDGKHAGRLYTAWGIAGLLRSKSQPTLCRDSSAGLLAPIDDIQGGKFPLTHASQLAFDTLLPYVAHTL